MKNEGQFGEINKSSKAKENFNFANEENNPRLNENYVYKHEENKIGGASNNTGHEYNDVSHLGKGKKSSLNQNELSKVTTTTSSTVATVGTVATTAIIVVVGGGMVVMGQSFDKPAICQFDELYAERNTINFALSLGNDQEKINSGEEKTECDIVVELTCESYSDFKEVKEVKNYGKVAHVFEGLDFSTEYTINVYQRTLLDIDYTALLEPQKITTDAENTDLPAVNDIALQKGTDSFGQTILYATVNFIDSSLGLSEFAIYVFDGEAASYEDINQNELLGVSYLDDDFNGKQQALDLYLDSYEGTHNVALVATKDPMINPDGAPKRSPEDGRPYPVILFQKEVDFASIEDSGITNTFQINLEKSRNPLGVITYYSTIDYVGTTSKYMEYELAVIQGTIDPEDIGGIDWQGRYYMGTAITKSTSVLAEWNIEDDDAEHTVAILGYIEGDAGTEEVVVYSQLINFKNLKIIDENQTGVYFAREIYYSFDSDARTEYSGTFNYIEDDAEYYSSFDIRVMNAEDTVQLAEFLISDLKEVGTFSFSENDSSYEYEQLYITVSCWSTKPEDIENYIEQNPGSGTPTEVLINNFWWQEVDFGSIPTRYHDPIYNEPVFYGAAYYFKRSNFSFGEHMLADISYEDESGYWSNFRVTFTPKDIESPTGDDVIEAELTQNHDYSTFTGKWLVEGLEQPQFEQLLQNQAGFEYQIIVSSTDPYNQGDSVVINSGDVNFYGDEFEYMNGCINIERIESGSATASQFLYYINLNIDNPDDYVSYEVRFVPLEESQTVQTFTVSYTEDEAYTLQKDITDLIDKSAAYKVATYATTKDGSNTEFVFSETIDFNNL